MRELHLIQQTVKRIDEELRKKRGFWGWEEEQMLWWPMGEEQEHVDWSQQGALSIEAHSRGDTRMERKGLHQEEAEQAKGISRLGKKRQPGR